jgi:hypothetical protein
VTPDQITFPNFLNSTAAFFGGGSGSFSSIERLASHVWLAIIIVGYILTFAGLVAIVYILMRLFDLREREKQFYETLIAEPEGPAAASPRYERIRQLAGGTSPSEWREAIIEADIMLDDALARRGYSGVGVGEKLQQAAGAFTHVHEAWEAHKVRNQIAHEGSAFDLSPTMVSRTLARYEAALRELGAL